MNTASSHEITQLLQAWCAGDQTALDKLIPLVEAELRRLAHKHMRGERPGHTLETRALINEAYLRLVSYKPKSFERRADFFALSAQIMRRILLDIVRQRPRVDGRQEARQVSLDDALTISQERPADLVALDDALKTLAEFDPLKSRIVELKFFGGLSREEVAEAIQLPLWEVKREWASAKAWLYRELRNK